MQHDDEAWPCSRHFVTLFCATPILDSRYYEHDYFYQYYYDHYYYYDNYYYDHYYFEHYYYDQCYFYHYYFYHDYEDHYYYDHYYYYVHDYYDHYYYDHYDDHDCSCLHQSCGDAGGRGPSQARSCRDGRRTSQGGTGDRAGEHSDARELRLRRACAAGRGGLWLAAAPLTARHDDFVSRRDFRWQEAL